MSDMFGFFCGMALVLFVLCKFMLGGVDVEKLQEFAEKAGRAIDAEFEKRDKRITELQERIRVLEEQHGRK